MGMSVTDSLQQLGKVSSAKYRLTAAGILGSETHLQRRTFKIVVDGNGGAGHLIFSGLEKAVHSGRRFVTVFLKKAS